MQGILISVCRAFLFGSLGSFTSFFNLILLSKKKLTCKAGQTLPNVIWSRSEKLE